MSITVEDLARACHEANRDYCRSIGDFTQPAWRDAPQWQKESAVAGVKFHLHNPNAMPEDSHNNWLKQKEKEGWRYGDVKDASKKTHPCMLPYEELPEVQKKKDEIFIATVNRYREFVEK